MKNLWLDLGEQSVHLTPKGWTVREDSPFLFYPMMSPQVVPVPSQENLESLRQYVNLEDEDDWICFQAWLLGMFMNQGTYPIMVLHGGEGSAKSFMSKLCRRLIDPSVPELAQYPRKIEDIDVAASSQFLLIYDNLSSINLSLSDMFCSLVTGTGIIKRELYSNEKPFVRQWKRPVIVNGIDPSLAKRQDFASRALLFNLPQILPQDRIEEEVLWPEIEDKMPVWIGSMLNALVHGLKKKKRVKVGLRLIDFASWAASCLTYFGYEEKRVIEALMNNRKTTQTMLVESDMVSREIVKLMDTNEVIEDVSPSSLYEILSERLTDEDRRSKDWPKGSIQFGMALQRAVTSLSQMGVHVIKKRGVQGRRLISLKKGEI
jgi:hypothetical protein